MNSKYQIIKIIAACLLLLSFFLPISSCTYTIPIDADPADPGSETRTVINYPREYMDFDEIGAWLNLLAFTWPIPLLLLQRYLSERKYPLLVCGVGVLLSVLTLAAIYNWVAVGEPLTGAYVGGGAAVALFILYVIELMEYFRERLSGKWKVESGKLEQDAE